MNKKGSVFLGVALGLFIFVMGVLVMPYLTDDVDVFRVNMNCTSDDLSGGEMITCLFGDAIIPYFIWFFSALAIGLILGGGS